MELKKNYINGVWCEAVSGKTRNVINPATGERIGITTESGREDAKRAIAAAKNAFYETGEWRKMSSQTRADVLLKIADKIEARKEELARIDTMDNGKPLRESQCDIEDAIHCFRYYAGLVTKPSGEVYEVNDGFGPMHTYSIREPIGVCGQITPWNYPCLMAVWKLAPALAAGNCIVFKPSSSTPLSAVILFEIFDEIGLPKGTVNLVLGSGQTVGQEIAENFDIDMVTFTGSTEVGQEIAKAAVGNLKKVGLELGGKSPNLIFADADLEGAVEWAMIGVFFNQGEVCSAGSRILVQDSIKDQFVKRLVERTKAMTLGNGLDNPDMGPLVSPEQLEKVLRFIQQAKEEGAECLCGGSRYTEGECAEGYFLLPTVFDQCRPEMKIVQEEVFGPVVTIQSFHTEQEAVQMANDTIYGLAGGIFTTDGARALRIMKQLRIGIAWINCYNPTYNEAPWGGYKMSGYGRELGVHGLQEYQEVKQVVINLAPGSIGWYKKRD